MFPQVPYFSRAWQCVVQIPLLSGIFLCPEMLTVAFYSFVYRQVIGFVLVSLCGFFFFFILSVDHFKVFLEFVTILLLFFMFWFFGHKACRILAPQPGFKPVSPALAGRVLTSGPPGKFLNTLLLFIFSLLSFKPQSAVRLL